jgi:predicted RNA-binding protein YlxR (DUF448 family)
MEGNYILKFYDSQKNIRKFLVYPGRGYYVINSEKCIDMETNTVLRAYDGNDNIADEAVDFELLLKERNELLQQ